MFAIWPVLITSQTSDKSWTGPAETTMSRKNSIITRDKPYDPESKRYIGILETLEINLMACKNRTWKYEIFRGCIYLAILNKSWQQHPTRRQLYGHLPPITKTIQARRTRHARHCWRNKDEIVRDVLLWTPASKANQKQDGQLEHTYSSYVIIRDVTLRTCQRRWMIGRRRERGSGISVLAARHDDDDDLSIYE